jgi:hypothetical protein
MPVGKIAVILPEDTCRSYLVHCPSLPKNVTALGFHPKGLGARLPYLPTPPSLPKKVTALG